MKPVGTALLVVCLVSIVVAGVVLSAPDVSPVWSMGGLSVLAGTLVLTHGRGTRTSADAQAQKRIVYEETVRIKDVPEEMPSKTHGKHEIRVRIVDVRGLDWKPAPADSGHQTLSARRSRTL